MGFEEVAEMNGSLRMVGTAKVVVIAKRRIRREYKITFGRRGRDNDALGRVSAPTRKERLAPMG
jgi:nanoRNase/pAp phosphatase (c-di-AMP/oligoRNAs hydrolase)